MARARRRSESEVGAEVVSLTTVALFEPSGVRRHYQVTEKVPASIPTHNSQLQKLNVLQFGLWELPAAACRAWSLATSYGEASPKRADRPPRKGGDRWELTRFSLVNRSEARP